jgi:hypothetical protein
MNMILATKEPLGRIIALAKIDDKIFPQKALEQKAENLIDLIIIRINSKSIEEVSESLLQEIFELRLDVIELLLEESEHLNKYWDFLGQYISVNLQLAPYSSLSSTISSVLLSYEEITSPILTKILGNSTKEILDGFKINRPSYASLNHLAFLPSAQLKYYKKWIDASLQFELGLILSDLILTGQVKISNERIENELVNFLQKIIIRFGAYSIFTGFWTPSESNLSNTVNSMKILAATIELDNKISTKVSKDSLFEMINNN